jgi:hypothetical protein
MIKRGQYSNRVIAKDAIIAALALRPVGAFEGPFDLAAGGTFGQLWSQQWQLNQSKMSMNATEGETSTLPYLP